MIELTVDGMTCGGCVKSVTRAVHAVDAQAQVEVDLASRRVRVDSSAPRAALVAAIDEAGYDVEDTPAAAGGAS